MDLTALVSSEFLKIVDDLEGLYGVRGGPGELKAARLLGLEPDSNQETGTLVSLLD